MIYALHFFIIPHFTIRVNSFCLLPWNLHLLLSIGYLTDEEPVPQQWCNSSATVSDMSLPSRQDAFPTKGFEHEVEHQGIKGREASDAHEEGCQAVADLAGYLGYGQGHNG